MRKILNIGQFEIPENYMKLTDKTLSIDIVNDNNKEKKVFLLITSEFDKYPIIKYLTNHDFLDELNIAVLKEKNINISFFESLDFKINVNKIQRPSYKQLIYQLIFEQDDKNVELLKDFDIKYICKVLSLTIHNKNAIEQLMDIEKFVYKTKDETLRHMLNSLQFGEVEGLLVFPKKKQKQIVEKKSKKSTKKVKYSITKKLNEISKEKQTKLLDLMR